MQPDAGARCGSTVHWPPSWCYRLELLGPGLMSPDLSVGSVSTFWVNRSFFGWSTGCRTSLHTRTLGDAQENPHRQTGMVFVIVIGSRNQRLALWRFIGSCWMDLKPSAWNEWNQWWMHTDKVGGVCHRTLTSAVLPGQPPVEFKSTSYEKRENEV